MTQKEKVWLEALNQAVEVINNSNLSYFLDTGTLLGAVRNGAFIPWDSDIDLGIIVEKMPSTNYIRQLSSEFFLSGFSVGATPFSIFLSYRKYPVNIGIYFNEHVGDRFVARLIKPVKKEKKLLCFFYKIFSN